MCILPFHSSTEYKGTTIQWNAPSFEAALPPGADRAEGGFRSGFSSPPKKVAGPTARKANAPRLLSLPACPHTAFTSPRPVCDALALTRPRPCETTLAFASPRQLTSSPSPSGPHTSSASTSNIITSSPPPALMPRLVSLNCILAPHPSLRPCLPSPPLTSPLPCIAIRPSIDPCGPRSHCACCLTLSQHRRAVADPQWGWLPHVGSCMGKPR